MKIWVDADACPGAVKEILFRAAERTGIQVTLVANQTLRTPKSKFVRSVVVERTFNAADHWICANIEADDLVITADVPLAAEAVEAGATALNPRGELYTKDNVRERLNMRDMMEDRNLEISEYRDSGIERAIAESRAFEAEGGWPEKPAHEIAEDWDRDHLMRERDEVWYLADMTWEIVEMPLI